MAQSTGGKGVNLNKATAEELEKISGLGKKRAQDLIDYRNQHGPFKSWDDVQDISGFSKKMVEDLKSQGILIR